MSPLKKVLIVGATHSIEHLSKILAATYPDVTFDYMSSDTTTSDIPNLNIIQFNTTYTFPVKLEACTNIDDMVKRGSCTALSGAMEWYTSHAKEYDFIIAPGLESQVTNFFDHQIVPTLCASAAVSRLETDKLYTKQILTEINVPTPDYTPIDPSNWLDDVKNKPLPLVFKLGKYVKNISNLGFGSWVFTEPSYTEKISNIINATNYSGQDFYVEEYIPGREVSVHFLCNGNDCEYMGSARDYKRIHNDDIGINTGSTGCYSPVEYFTEDIKDIVCDYATRLIKYITTNLSLYFRGILYLGIIIDETNKPYVLEIKTSPGSPEFSSILETINNVNLLDNLQRAASNQNLLNINTNQKYAVTVNIIHKNYDQQMKFNSVLPDFSDLPKDISLDSSTVIFSKFNYYCALTTTGTTKEEAATKIYNYLSTKDLKDYTYRTDIGFLE